MSNSNICINLEARKDGNGKTYYLSKVQSPVLIDLSEGAAFLVFVSDEGEEQLQIAPFKKKKKSEYQEQQDDDFRQE